MPLDEEGAKWSCEPCIRGHRSSKCQHFDRLMMKVPKAGRPLAKCPHPKGTCSCQKTYAFMVRIPKGSSCLCRPLYKVPAGANEPQSAQASMAPISSPSGKVQKAGRRQSNIQVAPENIVKAFENMPENLKFEDGVSQYLTNLPPYKPEQNGSSPTINHNNSFPPSSLKEPISNTQPKNESSCCSQKPSAPSVTPAGGGSCCSGKSSISATPPPNSREQKSNEQIPWNDMSYMNFSAQQISSWESPMVSTQGSYLPSFEVPGAQVQPFYMNGYTPNLSSVSYSNTMNELGISQSSMTQFALNHSHNPSYAPTNLGGDACHECKCGDECQCLGCAAHPFNNTTRQHVQEMGVIMTFDGDESSSEAIANGFRPSHFQGNTPHTPLNLFTQHGHALDHGVSQTSYEPYSDPSSTMPSGYSSPIPAGHHLNQQLMHPSEYYTLEYPVGLPSACSNVTGSCQCGNDCSCVGCLTHSGHNGVPLDAPIPETSATHSSSQQHSAQSQTPVTTTGSQMSRIPVLDNVSVPCLSPRTLETSMI
ncbi:hypothetical protein N7462_005654 [Penicillium macrosclerotiorum]|uniref:uncharacterized protein n=1 Tax=Penicillium macrosclerotiorum TaxID=303699 RepID=UPI0025484276|nr:uncharacterized protein N7462_005654 [Penicillium macrosclerotiorum]KAJ5682489.1 hypothetical protein N7462_005654 [Penicillium macrosclerotiorum]